MPSFLTFKVPSSREFLQHPRVVPASKLEKGAGWGENGCRWIPGGRVLSTGLDLPGDRKWAKKSQIQPVWVFSTKILKMQNPSNATLTSLPPLSFLYFVQPSSDSHRNFISTRPGSGGGGLQPSWKLLAENGLGWLDPPGLRNSLPPRLEKAKRENVSDSTLRGVSFRRLKF